MVHFLFVGSGAKKSWMEQEIARRGLANISIVGQRPRTDQINFLNACDVSIISLLPGITGAAVPSRLYNIMAAGRPVISVTGSDSEVSLIVQEEGIGWVVPPGDPEDLVRTILDAVSEPARLKAMGLRACAAANTKYPREKIIAGYRALLDDVGGAVSPES